MVLKPTETGRDEEKTQNGIETQKNCGIAKIGQCRDEEKTQNGIETLNEEIQKISRTRVATRRKPRTGLKRRSGATSPTVSGGRDEEKTQNGIETRIYNNTKPSPKASRRGENPERD